MKPYTQTPSKAMTVDDHESDWEYEYHETETEVGNCYLNVFACIRSHTKDFLRDP